MKMIPLSLIVIGIVIIAFPDIISYIIGFLFIFIGLQMFTFAGFFGTSKSTGPKGEEFIKFGKYKIYR